jgi:hypothetical protein
VVWLILDSELVALNSSLKIEGGMSDCSVELRKSCLIGFCVGFVPQGLRLYDADAATLRFTAESEAAFLDCCFEDESAALACSSDGSVRR